jgi:hypothetical protein
VLFEKRLRDGLTSGTIRVAFRRWRKPQVVAGHWYRLGADAGRVLVHDVRPVNDLSEDDAREAGFGSRDALLNELKGEAPIYKVSFGEVEDDPRETLQQSTDDFGTLDKQVARIERAGETLKAIQEQPGTRAVELAQQLGGWPDLLHFKLHVRRLKALGLTISLERGYRLSQRGEAYLNSKR